MLKPRAHVMITVKASPEPSKTYGDTVCVAGVWLRDGSPEWVRIYPVAFRHLQSEQQFRKYEVIEVDLTRSPSDTRHESYRPNWETLRRQSAKPLTTKARGPILEQLIGPTMCDLRKGVEQDLTAQSLGLVEVAEMRPLIFEKHGPWTPKQVQAMTSFMSQPELFGEVDDSPELVPPRYKVKYKYKCASAACSNWHEQRILDWELNALQHHNRHASDADLRSLISTKFYDEMWNAKVRTYFFVGNFADIAKRRSYSVLGVYKPPRESDWGSTLF
ncbi:hypothetical protein D9V29_11610 [Mycetocola manganoxydans]|uniref:Uncharacterized protein n=1 Tax=Mycetocola manganoxydans TaxID=699879 RepID=A0A3L6ZN88_9MICO|nr:hypothetical protein [Mycetocola manganoxydans]RLP69364.1 hypothetical protein D9V29_11610 [Mycetocola manganoxydans]GHD50900.1 hypothetical protein GCM10008097_25380 [Mycetocola manganoxydans]